MRRYLWKIKNIVLSLLGCRTVGARALVIKKGKVLLVKHSYMPGWYTIGGGVEKGETPVSAVQRELFEEVGIKCLKLPKLFNVYYNYNEKRDDYIIFYIVDDFKQETVYSPEILDSKWFGLQNLPEDASPATKRRVEEYLGIRIANECW